ncbi:hypothetical protein MSAN_00897400 [Mycena sanguinolenta]|uniref:Uncharacterized protein n=1 Tax=Mycena sanguinolenta TaxID=230812 RepID=A0A8H6YX46_9AGAR|nr:hypothetical protein MSAN_00897400 [Mycena sanguinolenta]
MKTRRRCNRGNAPVKVLSSSAWELGVRRGLLPVSAASQIVGCPLSIRIAYLVPTPEYPHEHESTASEKRQERAANVLGALQGMEPHGRPRSGAGMAWARVRTRTAAQRASDDGEEIHEMRKYAGGWNIASLVRLPSAPSAARHTSAV